MTPDRVYIYPRPRNYYDAAMFLVNSLLISHGIRRDALAIVRVGSRWVLAPGASVRHLRPDADTAIGWVRAVLRGKRLGATVEGDPPGFPGVYTVDPGEGDPRCLCSAADKVNGGTPACFSSAEECAQYYKVVDGCSASLEAWRSVAIVNILVDRIRAGLERLG